jgi:hypothetical protein
MPGFIPGFMPCFTTSALTNNLGFMPVSCRFHARFHTLAPKLGLVLATGCETGMKPNAIQNYPANIQHVGFMTVSMPSPESRPDPCNWP